VLRYERWSGEPTPDWEEFRDQAEGR